MKIIKLLLGFFISALCLFLAFRKVDVSELARILSSASQGWVWLAAFFGLCKIFCMVFRWRYFIPSSEKVGFSKYFYCYCVGNMANMILPFRSGDFIRSFTVADELKIPGAKVLGSLASEHILDVIILFMLLFMILALYSYHLPPKVIITVYAISLLIILLLGGLFFFKNNQKIINQIKLYVKNFVPAQFFNFSKIVSSFYSGFFKLGDKKNIFKLFLGTIFIWTLQGLWIYALLCSLGMGESYQLGFQAVLILIVMMGIAVMIPSSPSFLGTLHLMIVIALEQLGVPDNIALSYAIVVHAHGTVISIVLGIFSLWRGGFKFSSIKTRYVNQFG